MLLRGFKAARVEGGEGRCDVLGVVAGCCEEEGDGCGGAEDFGVRAVMEELLLCIGQPGWEVLDA